MQRRWCVHSEQPQQCHNICCRCCCRCTRTRAACWDASGPLGGHARGLQLWLLKPRVGVQALADPCQQRPQHRRTPLEVLSPLLVYLLHEPSCQFATFRLHFPVIHRTDQYGPCSIMPYRSGNKVLDSCSKLLPGEHTIYLLHCSADNVGLSTRSYGRP